MIVSYPIPNRFAAEVRLRVAADAATASDATDENLANEHLPTATTNDSEPQKSDARFEQDAQILKRSAAAAAVKLAEGDAPPSAPSRDAVFDSQCALSRRPMLTAIALAIFVVGTSFSAFRYSK